MLSERKSQPLKTNPGGNVFFHLKKQNVEDKPRDFFWPSYVDLFTALFAVVLVLFVLSFKLFMDKTKQVDDIRKQYEVDEREYQRFKQIEQQVQALEKNGTFLY